MFFFHRKSKSSLFSKRTLFLLIPIPLAVGLFALSGTGKGNRISVPVVSKNRDPSLVSASFLSNALESRPIPPEAKEHGTLLLYDEYQIENLSPFYSNKDHWFKKVSIDGKKNKGTIVFSKEDGKYLFKREVFEKSILKDKGDINLIIDLEINLKETIIPLVTSIAFSKLVYSPLQSIPLVRIDEEVTSLNCAPVSSSISFELTKTNHPISIKNFYFTFSDNPPLPFLNIFNPTLEDNYEGYIFNNNSKHKQVFLDRWANKNSNDKEVPKYEYEVKKGFWRSSCVDPYRVGGFIDENKKNTGEYPFQLDPKESFLEQQKKLYEDFNPIGDVNYLEYTTPSPCENLDDKTKKILFNSNVVPQAIKDFFETETTPINIKIIQGSFRAWHENDKQYYNSSYEEATQSFHTFDIKIDKKTVEERLVDHEKLKDLKDKQEISTQLFINLPHTLTFYDPTTNFLKKRKVDLNLSLDTRAIFNQNKYTKQFFTYDLRNIKGFSGFVVFSAGLFLDIEGNLNIQLITNVKGFVSNKDLRDRRNPEYKHLPPILIIEVNDEPKITSFYLDRKIDNNASYTPKDPSDSYITTLEDFKIHRLNKREVDIVKNLDRSNNGEVYFEKIDVTDPYSREQQNALKIKINEGKPDIVTVTEGGWWKAGSYFSSQYYIPRRNYGEVFIEEIENLNTVVFHIKGSTNLGGDFFRSMHYNTKITYCHTLNSNKSNEKCADGGIYETIIKNQSNNALKYIRDLGVEVDFNSLKEATKESPKVLNFQTVIHEPTGNYDKTRESLEYLLTEFKPGNVVPEKLPKHSLSVIWYSLEAWYDSQLKKVCYYTKLRPMSAIANLSYSGELVGNKDSHKIPGASAKAGFELTSLELKYRK